MEQQLRKLARQLDSFDEASLMHLWERYAAIVSHFEPTKRWEEAALVLGLIQAKRWKNQLFNQEWASRARPQSGRDGHGVEQAAPRLSFDIEDDDVNQREGHKNAGQGASEEKPKRAEILPFAPLKNRRTR